MCGKYYVYMILTERNTLYCGCAADIEKRFRMHLAGCGAKYTKANKPVKIVWQKEFETKSDAMKEEYRIKHKLTKCQKLQLINRG